MDKNIYAAIAMAIFEYQGNKYTTESQASSP